MPYPEYRSWQLFYMIEPWGWQNDEYHSALLAATLYNSNVTKKGNLKKIDSFMRKMQDEALKLLKEDEDVTQMTPDEILRAVKKDFNIK